MKKKYYVVAVVLLVCAAVAAALAVITLKKKNGEIQKENDPRVAAEDDLKVYYLNAGQGDSMLIVCPDGTTVMVDTGNADGTAVFLREYVRSLGIKKIDYLILTHEHSDHFGGAATILIAFDVGEIISNGKISLLYAYERFLRIAEKKGLSIRVPNPGNKITAGETEILFLGPLRKDYEDENDGSLVFKLTYRDRAFLFTGDSGITAESDMMDEWGKEIFDCDVLKLGHHGSHTASGDVFLQAVSPKYAIACCGENNDYGHPHTETKLKCSKYNIKLIKTWEAPNAVLLATDGKEKLTYEFK